LFIIKKLQRRNVFGTAHGYVVSCCLRFQVTAVMPANIGAP
jgi:hypothetical protein